MSRGPVLITAVVLLAIGQSTSVCAAPFFYSRVGAGVTNLVTLEEDSRDVLEVFTDTLGPFSAELEDGAAFASMTDGVFHVFATSTGFQTIGYGSARFLDTLLLTSGSLAPGTVVDLFAELKVSSAVSPNGMANPAGYGSNVVAGLEGMNSKGDAGSLSFQDHSFSANDIDETVGVIHGIVGQELSINVFLGAHTSLGGGTADASILGFFLTPLGDFTYTTASGNSYINEVQPVPEPSSLMLIGAGLVAVSWRVRQRRAGR
jgi:hypothetical protein